MRLSRRAVTRPGSGGAAASARSKAASIQSVTRPTSSSESGGNGGAGMTRVRTFWTTFDQVWSSFSTSASVSYAWRFRSAFLSAELWQA